jgi:chaperonin cofactor prefoldin
LNEEQKRIITLYALQEDNNEARKELGFIFENLKSSINGIVLNEQNNETRQKLDEIKTMINNDYNDIRNLNDETVTFYLGMSKLEKELANG